MTYNNPRAAVADETVETSSVDLLAVDVSRAEASAVVCRIAGDLDLGTVDAARATLNLALTSRAQVLVVDLSAVEFCDSAGLNMLLQIRLDAVAVGTTMRLASPGAAVARIFELTGADSVFSIHASTEEASHA
jgi:anti-anti-sigma factor